MSRVKSCLCLASGHRRSTARRACYRSSEGAQSGPSVLAERCHRWNAVPWNFLSSFENFQEIITVAKKLESEAQPVIGLGCLLDVLTSRRNMGRSTTVSTRDPFANFKANINIIHATNARNLTYKLGVHQFAGQTQEEFAATYTRLKPESLWRDLPSLGTHEFATMCSSWPSSWGAAMSAFFWGRSQPRLAFIVIIRDWWSPWPKPPSAHRDAVGGVRKNHRACCDCSDGWYLRSTSSSSGGPAMSASHVRRTQPLIVELVVSLTKTSSDSPCPAADLNQSRRQRDRVPVFAFHRLALHYILCVSLQSEKNPICIKVLPAKCHSWNTVTFETSSSLSRSVFWNESQLRRSSRSRWLVSTYLLSRMSTTKRCTVFVYEVRQPGTHAPNCSGTDCDGYFGRHLSSIETSQHGVRSLRRLKGCLLRSSWTRAMWKWLMRMVFRPDASVMKERIWISRVASKIGF